MPPVTNAPARTKASVLLEAAASLAPRLNETITRAMLIKHLAATAGGSAAQFTIRDAFAMLECAVVANIGQAGEGAEQQLSHLIQTYLRLPTHTVRSELQVSRQQFSTPAPLALFAQSRAGLCADDLMLEPSVGTGLLATEAARLNAELHLNELDPQPPFVQMPRIHHLRANCCRYLVKAGILKVACHLLQTSTNFAYSYFSAVFSNKGRRIERYSFQARPTEPAIDTKSADHSV